MALVVRTCVRVVLFLRVHHLIMHVCVYITHTHTHTDRHTDTCAHTHLPLDISPCLLLPVSFSLHLPTQSYRKPPNESRQTHTDILHCIQYMLSTTGIILDAVYYAVCRQHILYTMPTYGIIHVYSICISCIVYSICCLHTA